MPKAEKEEVREIRKQKTDQHAGKKMPRYLRDGTPGRVVIAEPKPTKKGTTAA